MSNNTDWKTISTRDENNIKGFFGDYRFLSNYHLQPVWFEGLLYSSNEHAFQAAKTTEHNIRLRYFSNENDSTCATAKKNGQKSSGLFTLRDDWEEVKFDIMAQLTVLKFINSYPLKKKLLRTGERYLEETNWWNDTTWGVCNNIGENMLGKILMKTREFIK